MDVNNVKCVNCKNCIGFENGYYWCQIGIEVSCVEECVANDDNLGCDLYVEDNNDDTAA